MRPDSHSNALPIIGAALMGRIERGEYRAYRRALARIESFAGGFPNSTLPAVAREEIAAIWEASRKDAPGRIAELVVAFRAWIAMKRASALPAPISSRR